MKIQPKSGREATEAFLQGSGDVLLSYENEALFIERNGDPVEHVTPPQTFKIENPTAVVTKGKGAAQAKAFNDYLFTPAAQELWAQAGFRPVDPTVAAKYAKDFPQPEKLWTIADLGGWKDGRLDAVQEGHRRHRQDLRRGHPVGAMTTTTRPREGLVETSPSSDPRAGTPPTREGGRPRLAPGRALGVGVVGLWLSVIVLLPLAALTVALPRRGARRLLGCRDRAGRGGRHLDHPARVGRRRPAQRRHGHAHRLGARA